MRVVVHGINQTKICQSKVSYKRYMERDAILSDGGE